MEDQANSFELLREFEETLVSSPDRILLQDNTGNKYELLFNKSLWISSAKSIIISFAGAGKHGNQILTKKNNLLSNTLPVIHVIDPFVSDNVLTGWHTGAIDEKYQQTLIQFFKILQRYTGKRIIFVGPNSGGFAALNYGRMFKGDCHVLAWDAHTDIFEAPETYSKPYFKALLGLSNISLKRNDWREYTARRIPENFKTNICSIETINSPSRITFLCDQGNQKSRSGAEMLWEIENEVPLQLGINESVNGAIFVIFEQKKLQTTYAELVNSLLDFMTQEQEIELNNITLSSMLEVESGA